jgi:hypothetical protein
MATAAPDGLENHPGDVSPVRRRVSLVEGGAVVLRFAVAFKDHSGCGKTPGGMGAYV